MSEGLRRYHYVGPAHITATGPEGHPIRTPADLTTWLAAHEAESEDPFTFVVDLDGILRLAPRQSEHIACAGGAPVLSAGEITFTHDQAWRVTEVSNQSTGYCPDPDSWPAVERALDNAALNHPGHFTTPVIFRRCPDCQERNLVKDNHYFCALCDTELPRKWNFDLPDEQRNGA